MACRLRWPNAQIGFVEAVCKKMALFLQEAGRASKILFFNEIYRNLEHIKIVRLFFFDKATAFILRWHYSGLKYSPRTSVIHFSVSLLI
jgi:hypothetical protein